MRDNPKNLLAASALLAGLVAAPVLYAHEPGNSNGSMMGSGSGMMGRDGMMSQGGMMGMMNMMGQMSGMMESCNKMMQSMVDRDRSGKPNEQWKKGMPGAPERND